MPTQKIIHGECLDVLRKLPDNSLHSLVTDPPAGISFMGKHWDSNKGGRDQWILWLTDVMAECLRVLKPGAHGLVWALPRTSHWTATALENAGFEVRDVIVHLFGTGFPKSLDVSKAIDKAAGAEREVVRSDRRYRLSSAWDTSSGMLATGEQNFDVTAPATPEAQQWQGWGTALKPASEHWILVRKPLSEKTVAANVLEHGTGAINIGVCRIPHCDALDLAKHKHMVERLREKGGKLNDSSFNASDLSGANEVSAMGRWPANVVFSEDASAHLEQQAGGASRFFYVAKPSSKEKNAGCESLPDALGGSLEGGDDKRSGKPQLRLTKNNHPTVKPIALMQHFIRMVTPPKGIIVDPFLGSGTTLVAAKQLGCNALGIERESEYVDIAKSRLSAE